MKRPARYSNTERKDPHWIEWLTGIVSCVLVGAMIGWLVWHAVTADDRPPDLSTKVTGIVKSGEVYRVEFEIVNAAPTTAAGVTVRGEVKQADGALESAEVTFDYVPAQSASRGALLFHSNPGGADFQLRPSGYTDP